MPWAFEVHLISKISICVCIGLPEAPLHRSEHTRGGRECGWLYCDVHRTTRCLSNGCSSMHVAEIKGPPSPVRQGSARQEAFGDKLAQAFRVQALCTPQIKLSGRRHPPALAERAPQSHPESPNWRPPRRLLPSPVFVKVLFGTRFRDCAYVLVSEEEQIARGADQDSNQERRLDSDPVKLLHRAIGSWRICIVPLS